MQITTNIEIFFSKLLGYLPFGALYLLSDLLYYFIRLSGYRRKLVYKNLKNSFPEKSEKEIKEIMRKFYHHFCDIFLETLKIRSLSDKEIQKRVTVSNIDILNKYYNEDRDVICIAAHYGNWEWAPCINLFCKPLGCAVYHPLKNKLYDRFMLKLRSKWGTLNFPMKSSYRDILRLKKENTRFFIGMISDQSPSKNKIQYKTQFLNQLTPVHIGAEKMAIKTNSPVVFSRIDKVKRGYYHITIEPLIENPKDYKEFEITDIHTRHLEKIIREKPEYWLWSHNRWKHTKPKQN